MLFVHTVTVNFVLVCDPVLPKLQIDRWNNRQYEYERNKAHQT